MTEWTVRLAEAAEQDFEHIYLWTVEAFGIEQAHTYRETILDALDALRDGPDVIGVRDRADLLPGLKTLHVSRNGRRGRHFIMFDALAAESRIRVWRILHDAMDLHRHLSDEKGME